MFLGVVTGSKEPWTVPLRLNCQQIEFCIDTGEEVSVIPESVYTGIGMQDYSETFG